LDRKEDGRRTYYITAAKAGIGLAQTSYLLRTDVLWQTNRATDNNVTGLLLPQSVIAPISGPVRCRLRIEAPGEARQVFCSPGNPSILDTAEQKGAEYAWRAAYQGYHSITVTKTPAIPATATTPAIAATTTTTFKLNQIGGYGSPFANDGAA